ncbi:PREDICTED: uncharacterized protein At3g43530-like [Camelina sativa]|uniref:Uncharacterized protein At3g43530-like n=1 Tax=Camelina sativa TaxID=90675 RepID=A0ABM1QCA6_CAMSA|nr:PREDICTED: uncharacterized protein At3g43530-like [Camelina sativa]
MAIVRDGGRVYDSTEIAVEEIGEALNETNPLTEPSLPTELSQATEEREAEGDGEEEISDAQDTNDDDEDQPLQPEDMFFYPPEYTKSFKLGTRCSVTQTVNYINQFEPERKWFREHSQFKHIFHMTQEPNHMIQGMWIFFLRTACTEMQRECWFVVNGVPVRYSLREHALLTGLDCHDYPNFYYKEKKLWSYKCVQRVFGRNDKIKISDVEAKLEEMQNNSTDRRKLTILYFLSKMVVAKSKADGNIDPFILSVIDDLDACEKFPWGHSFNKCMNGVRSAMTNLKGSVKGSVKPNAQITFSGFIIPLEILAFECIPHLQCKFRVVVPAEKDCPRMCKYKFSESLMRGFSLDEINAALGSIKVRVWYLGTSINITSILKPDEEEKTLLRRIIDDNYADEGIGFIDPIVDSWREHLIVKKKKILWKGVYQTDLEHINVQIPYEVNEKVDEFGGDELPEPALSLLQLKETMEKGFSLLNKKIGDVEEKIKGLDVRVVDLERCVAHESGKGVKETYTPQPIDDMNL